MTQYKERVPEGLHWFARASVTKCHRLEDLYNRNVFSWACRYYLTLCLCMVSPLCVSVSYSPLLIKTPVVLG